MKEIIKNSLIPILVFLSIGHFKAQDDLAFSSENDSNNFIQDVYNPEDSILIIGEDTFVIPKDTLVDDVNYYYFETPVDSQLIMPRSFDTKALEDYKLNPEYNYENDPKYDTSLWGLIREAIANFIKENFGENAEQNFWKYFNYSLAILGLVILLYALMKMSGNPVIQKERKKNEIRLDHVDETTPGEKLEDFLKLALDQKNYRAAIRIQHILMLKTLESAGQIQWEEYKTNTDFAYEIDNEDWRSTFKQLSWIYENAWYGEFNVSEEDYLDFERNIKSFKTNVTQKIIRGE